MSIITTLFGKDGTRFKVLIVFHFMFKTLVNLRSPSPACFLTSVHFLVQKQRKIPEMGFFASSHDSTRRHIVKKLEINGLICGGSLHRNITCMSAGIEARTFRILIRVNG